MACPAFFNKLLAYLARGLLQSEDDSFRYARKPDSIDREKKLDGAYVIRSNVKAELMSDSDVIRGYKQLSNVERAFRGMKSVDLKVRPIHHRLADRVRAHVFLRMLAPGGSEVTHD